jgi:hypothetical protein
MGLVAAYVFSYSFRGPDSDVVIVLGLSRYDSTIDRKSSMTLLYRSGHIHEAQKN